MLNGYIAMYDSKEHKTYASTLYEAKCNAVEFFKPPKSKQHMVHVHLCEHENSEVKQSTQF